MIKENNKLYNNNINYLYKYRYIQNKCKIINYKCILNSGFKDFNTIIIRNLDKSEKKIFVKKNIDLKNYNMNFSYLIMNEYFIDNIIDIQKNKLSSDVYIYLYYENLEEFLEILQIIDITSILRKSNVVFFFSENELKSFFGMEDAVFPQNYINLNEDIINIIKVLKIKKIEILKKNIDNYYNNLDLKNIRNNFKLLLFDDDKFSYDYIRDFSQAFKYSNIQYNIFTEMNKYSQNIDEYAFLNCILSYKPSVVLMMETTQNEFKFYINENLVVITWLDMILKFIYSPNEYLNGLSKYNILLLPVYTIEKSLNEDITSSKKYLDNVIKVPFVCNHKIYKTYKTNKNEQNKYSSDICIVTSNNGLSRLDSRFNYLYFSKYNKYTEYDIKLRKVYENIKNKVYNETYLKEFWINDINWYRGVITKEFDDNGLFDLGISVNAFEMILKLFSYEIGSMVYRGFISEWIIEKEYNVKFWGDNWDKEEKFKKFAMGCVKNGRELSKIYNLSKITLGTLPTLSLHTRTFESILSNSFCLICEPPKDDWGNVKIFFKEKENIDFYSNKQDLYDKLDYYLEHEDKRKQIIESGKKLIFKEKLYLDEVLKNALEEIICKIEKIAMEDEL